MFNLLPLHGRLRAARLLMSLQITASAGLGFWVWKTDLFMFTNLSAESGADSSKITGIT